MKIARFFAVIFSCLGVLLLIGSIGLCLLSLNAPVRILEMPSAAAACSDAFAQALNEGDLEGAARLMYGQPDLGVSTTPSDPEGALVWDAFRSSIAFEFTGKCYATDSGLARKGTITTLVVASVTKKLPQRTQFLVDQRIASAKDLADIYDENNQFREDLVKEILQQALQQSLSQDTETVTRDVTLKLIFRDGKWWVVPDQALLQAISGVA